LLSIGLCSSLFSSLSLCTGAAAAVFVTDHQAATKRIKNLAYNTTTTTNNNNNNSIICSKCAGTKAIRPITETAREYTNANKHTHKRDKKSYLQNSRNNKVVKENLLRQKNCSWIYWQCRSIHLSVLTCRLSSTGPVAK